MAHVLVLLDSAKQGHWRFLLNMSVQESDCSSCPRLLTMFSPGPLLAPVNTGHGWSMRRKHACLFLLFTPFLSELTEDKCVTVEVINVHFQDMIYWHFLSERRQTFVSFRTPREFSVMHHNLVKRWLPEAYCSCEWCSQHRGKDSIAGRLGLIPTKTWE